VHKFAFMKSCFPESHNLIYCTLLDKVEDLKLKVYFVIYIADRKATSCKFCNKDIVEDGVNRPISLKV